MYIIVSGRMQVSEDVVFEDYSDNESDNEDGNGSN
jgi:hypothetical protein